MERIIHKAGSVSSSCYGAIQYEFHESKRRLTTFIFGEQILQDRFELSSYRKPKTPSQLYSPSSPSDHSSFSVPFLTIPTRRPLQYPIRWNVSSTKQGRHPVLVMGLYSMHSMSPKEDRDLHLRRNKSFKIVLAAPFPRNKVRPRIVSGTKPCFTK